MGWPRGFSCQIPLIHAHLPWHVWVQQHNGQRATFRSDPRDRAEAPQQTPSLPQPWRRRRSCVQRILPSAGRPGLPSRQSDSSAWWQRRYSSITETESTRRSCLCRADGSRAMSRQKPTSLTTRNAERVGRVVQSDRGGPGVLHDEDEAGR